MAANTTSNDDVQFINDLEDDYGIVSATPAFENDDAFDDKLAQVQANMDDYYVDNERPSDRMEALINQAEQEARELDTTLDRILELEESGIENALNTPEANADKGNDVSVDEESSARQLLKDLYRRKQHESSATKSAPSKESSLEL